MATELTSQSQCVVNAKASVRLLLDFAASQEQLHVLRALVHQAYLEGFEDGALWQDASENRLASSNDSQVAGAATWTLSESCAAVDTVGA